MPYMHGPCPLLFTCATVAPSRQAGCFRTVPRGDSAVMTGGAALLVGALAIGIWPTCTTRCRQRRVGLGKRGWQLARVASTCVVTLAGERGGGAHVQAHVSVSRTFILGQRRVALRRVERDYCRDGQTSCMALSGSRAGWLLHLPASLDHSGIVSQWNS
jgi:hypothetical protein